jgi:hypothetical protein
MVRIPACYFSDGQSNQAGYDAWIADCGSNRHTTNDIRDYVRGSIKKIHIEVHVGDGVTIVTKMGDIMLIDTKTCEYVRLRDVLFLPDCSKKLLSESLMDQANYSQIKPGNGQANVVCNTNNRVLMSAKLQADGLYEFTNLKVISNDKNAPLSDYRTMANEELSANMAQADDLFCSPISRRRDSLTETEKASPILLGHTTSVPRSGQDGTTTVPQSQPSQAAQPPPSSSSSSSDGQRGHWPILKVVDAVKVVDVVKLDSPKDDDVVFLESAKDDDVVGYGFMPNLNLISAGI